jgi:3D-(3,5/4)-trihydroxycyclohexane-1,2-dione acylhydrolase (decyclizing)
MIKADQIRCQRQEHALAIVTAGGYSQALSSGKLPKVINTTLAEVIVLGLLCQGVRTFFSVLGHGSTEIGEVLRIYQEQGLIQTLGLRSEIEASHAAAALRWVTGEKAAVVTSIGPGALQALAAALVPASDGIGVWYLFGDETTQDEGFNMQQIPKHEQNLFQQLCATLGKAYTLHTPLAVTTALRRGLNTVDHPYKAGPFFLLMPMNTQPVELSQFSLDTLPVEPPPSLGSANADYGQVVDWLKNAERILVKVGGGARSISFDLGHFLERIDGVAVHTPIAAGIIPYSHKRCMGVGGSKGSICGNYAMEHADLLLAIGTRAVCQSDCSRTGYPNVKNVININADIDDATHYQNTMALVGDINTTLHAIFSELNIESGSSTLEPSTWLKACSKQKQIWEEFKTKRFQTPCLFDDFWGREVLTQPAAIKVATDWADENNVIIFFDAGDVQANGFQVVESASVFTETGASYMGFAASAILATEVASKPFYALALTGDGSFTMSPQILIDGAEFGARGCILMLDNNRMGAITGLQYDQYGQEFATRHTKSIDYLAWANAVPGVLALDGGNTPESLFAALEQAFTHDGLSFIHLPVYYGDHELGGLGVYGRWNVGNWCEETQSLRHKIGL